MEDSAHPATTSPHPEEHEFVEGVQGYNTLSPIEREDPEIEEEDEETQLIREEQRLVQRRQTLERIQKLRGEVAALEESVSKPPRRKPSPTSSSEGGVDIKMKNAIQLPRNPSFKGRDEWLGDMTRIFQAAPKRYNKDEKRILTAVDNMDIVHRNRWTRYLSDLPDLEAAKARRNWDLFREWTVELVKDGENRLPLAAKQLNDAMQRENQTPREFHDYMDSLERNFELPTEKQRALQYLAKLQPDLHRQLQLHGTLPETRAAMVSLAERFWDQMRTTRKRSRPDAEEGTYSPRRRRFSTRASSSNPTRRGSISREPHSQNRTTYTRGNYIGKDGKQATCFKCGSTQHLANTCTQPAKANEARVRGRGKWQGQR